MAIEEKTYLMCNYSTSPLIVSMRENSVFLEGGRRDAPITYPFTMRELVEINNTSTAIKSGRLVPTEEQKEYIYNQLRITDWKDILSDEQIEQIILYPTVEGLKRLLDIKDSFYFERVYGAYIGLRNVNAPISANIGRLIRGRYEELQRGKINTEFSVQERDIGSAGAFASAPANRGGLETENEELRAEINELKALVKQLTSDKKSSGAAKANNARKKPTAKADTQSGGK